MTAPVENTEQAVATAAQWKKNRNHKITLLSGTVVEIRIPDLPALVKSGQIPNELISIAIEVSEGKKEINKESIIEQAVFFNKLCALMVVSPKVTEEDFESEALPFEDKEMLVEFGTRQRDIDAVGHHIAGLEKLDTFRAFRGITAEYADLASA
jgi:hypothetical protein